MCIYICYNRFDYYLLKTFSLHVDVKRNEHCSPYHGSSEEHLPIKGHRSPHFQNDITNDVKRSLAVPLLVQLLKTSMKSLFRSEPITISDDEDDACEDSQLEYWIKELQLGDPAHGILSLIDHFNMCQEGYYHGPFVWIRSCLHGVEKKEILVAMSCQR